MYQNLIWQVQLAFINQFERTVRDDIITLNWEGDFEINLFSTFTMITPLTNY